ncbi:MAG TPA: DJ-1/PfpI family protein [Thermoanaerobaculia bacterium]|nr:DJ-1/PfpI family protein [Thermoanaerobaculia bacterium]
MKLGSLFLIALAVVLSGSAAAAAKLTVPKDGVIKVAVVLTDSATMIDFAGPWEVFQDSGQGNQGFQLYTVSETREPLKTTGGMTVIPEYTFDDAPVPRIVVVGAQKGSPKLVGWLKKMANDKDTDIVMSVCTGAFKLAATGLLDGKKATTHHDFHASLKERFPKVDVQKGLRYVQSDEKLFTAGGLTSGIDLALHVVELYFGRAEAERTAAYMEYGSTAWKEAR